MHQDMIRRQAPQPVRRSTRIRQKTSPYFQCKKKGASSVSRASTKPQGANAETAGSKSRPTKLKSKAAPKATKVKSEDDAESKPEVERVHGLAREANFYGLIQEIVTPNVFRLLVATCLLNQTKGRAAMPVFWELLRRWPDEHRLAKADLVELTDLLQPIGLHNIRARRLINMAQTMVEIPYDEKNLFKSRDRTAPDTPIGIYPGVGRYAIDSWRIFVAGGGASVGLDGQKPVSPFDTVSVVALPKKKEALVLPPAEPRPAIEPEWKSVMPLDKELRAYLIWRWAQEGQQWDPLRGVVPASSDSQ